MGDCRQLMKMGNENIITLDRGHNTTCTVNLFGANVVSWRVNQKEQLFVSRRAQFDDKQPIRGGVPVVFPHFGKWTFGPHHGFARIAHWKVEKEPEQLVNRDVVVILSLEDNDFTRSMWNYPFKLIYRLTLKERELYFNIHVCNTSTKFMFGFNLLFHTHIRVPDVRNCKISGLYECLFIDKTQNNSKHNENEILVNIKEYTSRIYKDTEIEHVVTNIIFDRNMRIKKKNLPDTVVWNPWIEHSKGLPDFDSDEYLKMICVEPGHASERLFLLPGNVFEAEQILEVLLV